MESATLCAGISQTTKARKKKEIKTFPTTRRYRSCEYWKDYIILLIIILKSWIFYRCYRSVLTNGISVMMEVFLYLYILIPILLVNTWNETSATEQLDFTIQLDSVHMWLLNSILVCVKLLQSCPTLCILMDCSPLGSSVHEILQARILEWTAMSFSRGSSQPRDLTPISYGS